MYLNYNIHQIHLLFNEFKKCISTYICGWRDYQFILYELSYNLRPRVDHDHGDEQCVN
jgi:hypothetical protein